MPAGCGHGTHVAGIAAGGPVSSPTDLTGVAPGASVIAVKVFTKGMNTTICQGAFPCLLAYDSDIAEALKWLSDLRTAADPLVVNLDAVNLSLGGGSFSGACDAQVPTITAQVNALRAQGIATVVAAGNSGQNGTSGSPARMASPACISTTVSVGATTNSGAIAGFSNLTAGTTIVAPGSSITSSKPTSTYGLLSGTSMAAPVVAGAIAALREQTPASSVTAVVDLLRTAGSPLTTAVGQIPELQLDSAALGVPSKVRQLSTVPVDQSVNVSWSVPAYAGTSSIGGYTVTASPGGRSCTTATTSCTVTGLTNGATYTFSVVATNLQGTGTAVTATGSPRTTPPSPAPPVGVGGNRQVAVTWAAPSGTGGSPITGYIARAFPGGQSCTSGASTLGCTIIGLVNGTSYVVTVAATNAAGEGASSGNSSAVVPKVAGVSPFGSFDTASAGVGSVSVSGWAIDPETSASIPVHVYVDSSGTALTANGSRPDVDLAYGYGPDHGFTATVPASGGPHTVCAYAINATGSAGANVGLGCRTVTVPTGPPVGSFDVATAGPGTVSVGGWAIDPDTASPIAVHVYVDAAGTALTAGGFRSDIAAFFGPFGGNHAFNGVLPASAGTHTVCAYGINTGPGANVLLGCKVVTVPGGSPFGSFDAARRNLDGTVSVGGWAIDPDTASPIAVHVYAVGPGYPLTGAAITANVSRSDLASIFPAYGAPHGFSATVLSGVPSGATVCAYGIDVGVGDNVLLGCKVVT